MAVSYKFLSEVPSKLEIQCKKGTVKWGDFDNGCYFINTNTLPSRSSILRLISLISTEKAHRKIFSMVLVVV